MEKNQTIKAKHQKLDGSTVEIELIATQLMRQSKDEAPKFYPYLKDPTFDNIQSLMGVEYVQELVCDSFRTKVQQLWNKAISANTDEKTKVTDESKATEDFLESFLDPNFSQREVTVDTYMRKAISVSTGKDEKFENTIANKSEPEKQMARTMKMAEYIQKAQELTAKLLAK